MPQADRSRLDRLFRPRKVAIIGASADPGKTAGRPLRLLRKGGFAGDIWLVNPRRDEIDGVTCFADIAALPGAPDVAMILVGPERAEQSLRALSDAGTGAAIVLGSGYAEIGPDGAMWQRRLVDACGPMRLLGPNTIGLVNLGDGITLSASGALDADDPPTGGVAIVSQSGGILGSLLSRAAARGVGLSHLVATGNEADLEVCDIADYLLDDPSTSVIALYLETLRHADRFRTVAEEAARRGKPIVVYKVGRSEPGARSAASHTGAMAGEDRLYDALFDRVGAIRVARYDDLIDVSMALSAGGAISGQRLAILTTTGGAGGLVADVCGMAGFETPVPGHETVADLSALMRHDGFASDRNPIDLTLAGLDPGIIRGALTTLAGSPDFDAVICVVGSSAVGQPARFTTPLIEIASEATKPVLAYASPSAPEVVRRLNANGVPAFETPEGCAAALEAVYRTGRFRPTPVNPVPPRPAGDVFADRSGPQDEVASKQIFAAYGIPVVGEAVARDPDEAESLAAALGPEVVVKILAQGVAHKSDLGGVRIGVPVADVAAACRDMAAGLGGRSEIPLDGFVVQECISGGVEMLLGFIRDPQIGPAIMLGAGGIATELYDDTAIRLPPLCADDVPAMLETLKIGRLLQGFRGRPPCDIAALSETVLAFASMCAAFGDRLVEAEINPLFVLPEGQGVGAADGFVVLR